MKRKILSNVTSILWPNNIRISFKWKLVIWEQRFCRTIERSYQNVWTFRQCHKRCWIVSLWDPQNSHKSLWFVINFEADLLVVRICWRILIWNQCSLVSVVVFFNIPKLFNQKSLPIFRLFCHFCWPVITFFSEII